MSDRASRVLYADTSALVKLIVREAVAREIGQWRGVATSAVTTVELGRYGELGIDGRRTRGGGRWKTMALFSRGTVATLADRRGRGPAYPGHG